jgi:(p)ppGpp synthase/HD superfamily hydrolase
MRISFPLSGSPLFGNPDSMSLLEKAIAIAVEAHQGKKDTAGNTYILHPLRVMFRVETEDEKIVAILHDVVEDHTDVWPVKRLRDLGFPPHILEALDCVTKREGEPYEKFVERSASNPIALHVKLADLEDNLDVRSLNEVTEKDLARLNRYLAAYRRLRSARPR